MASTEIVGSFGERAIAQGFLSQSQLNLILLHQRSRQQPIGNYFIEQNILTGLTLRHQLRELDKHNKQVRDSAALIIVTYNKKAGQDRIPDRLLNLDVAMLLNLERTILPKCLSASIILCASTT